LVKLINGQPIDQKAMNSWLKKVRVK